MNDDRADIIWWLLMLGLASIIVIFASKYVAMERERHETAGSIKEIARVYWKALPEGVRYEIKKIARSTANTALLEGK